MLRILAIDDEDETCFAVNRALKLQKMPFTIQSADTRIGALELIADFRPHLIIVDYYTVASDITVDKFIIAARQIHTSKIAIFTGMKINDPRELSGTDIERAAKLDVKIFLKTHNHLRDILKILTILEANY